MIVKWIITIGIAIGLSACDSGGRSDAEVDATPVTDNNLPPDPGEEGKVTISGIDTDDDGVRDDVQIVIYKRYPEDESKKIALKQSAKALQSAISAGSFSDQTSIIDSSTDVLQSVDCLHQIMEDPTSEISFIENSVVNTTERSDAYIEFNEGVSGQFFGGDDSSNPCQ